MASRFWVGGTGTWDASTTANWSATTGGASGASVPGAADTAIFDASSGAAAVTTNYAVSVAALTLDTGFTGSLTFGATFTHTVSGAVTLTRGTLNTNDQTCSWGSFSSSNSNVRTLTLGASSITVTGASGTQWDQTTSTNLTFNANTSTITFSGISVTMQFGGKTLNNVVATGAGTITVGGGSGNPTFANFTRTGTASPNDVMQVSGNMTVTGVLTMTGNSISNRLFVRGTTIGTRATITCNGSVSMTNVDFRDVGGAGTAAPFTGTSVGDGQNNLGITFDAPVTRYWVGDGGNWNSTAHWATTSGGSSGASAPLLHDTAIIDANSITIASQTITANTPNLSQSINFTGVLNNPIFTNSGVSAVSMYGDVTLDPAMTTSVGGAVWTFVGRGSRTLTSAGVQWKNSLVFAAPASTYTLGSDLNTNSSLTIQNGTFTAGIYNVTVSVTWNLGGGLAQTINMGSGIWTFPGIGTKINLTNFAGLTFNAQTSTLIISDTSSTSKTVTISGGALTLNNVQITGGGTGPVTFLFGVVAKTITNLTIGAPKSVLISSGSILNVTTLNATGSVGNIISLTSNASGTPFTLSKPNGSVSCDYLSLQDSTAIGGAGWYAGANSTDVSGNTGWRFTALPADVLPRMATMGAG